MSYNLDNIDKLIANLSQSKLNEAMNKAGEELVRIVKEEAPGGLKETIHYRRRGNLTVEVFSSASYAIFVEKGRNGFTAKNAKSLRFEIDGHVVFCKKVGPTKANPFMARAKARITGKFKDLFRKILIESA